MVAYNDNMAAGALLGNEENGHSVPEHVSVIGFDDALISRCLRPRLTSVRYPIQLMAEKPLNWFLLWQPMRRVK